MRKIVALGTAVAAHVWGAGCGPARAGGGGAVVAPSGDVGALSAPQAVERFVQAARATDVRAMGALFGTSAGPVAARDPATDVEKRMRALACYLRHDAARLVEDMPAVTGAGRSVTMELRQRELVRRPRFAAVPGPRGRWFVESFDINAVSDFCRPE